MSRKTKRSFLRIPRRVLYPWMGCLLVFTALGAIVAPTTSQATQATSFTINSSSATVALNAGVTLSESGLPPTAIGQVDFELGGSAVCLLNLSGQPNETTSCTAPGYAYPGTFSYNAVFADSDGDFYASSSSNSVTVTVSPQTTFSILLNTTTSLTVAPGETPTLSAIGLPSQATGAVTFSASGATLCTANVSPDDSVCQVPGSLAAGTYSITATFVDTDGRYSGSTSSNSATLVVGTQTAFTISILNSSSVPTSTMWITANSPVTLSESGLPSVAIGAVSFSANGTLLCTVDLTAGFEEATACAPSIQAGTNYVITATFTDTNGVLLNSASSNSVNLNVYPDGGGPPSTNFTITVNNSSSATIAAGSSATLAEVGLPSIVTGTVTITGSGYNVCTITLTGQTNEPTTCSSSISLGVGNYDIGAEFNDPSGSFAYSIASNTLKLTVTPAGAPTSPPASPTTSPSPASPSSPTTTAATSPTTPPATSPSTPPPPVGQGAKEGYDLVGSDGGIFTFGSALFYGSTGSLKLQRPVVGITPTPDHGGYWLVASDGGIFAFGDAGFYGSIPGLGLAPAGSSDPKRLNAPIVGMVPSADGGGYFMVAADGGVFAFGDAKFEGSCPSIGGCAGAAVAVMPDATGDGYWLVTSTGGVYAFGDAASYGAPGPQSVPVTSAVRTIDGAGYWILFANGVVDAYGDATDLGGPTSSVDASDPATTIFTTADGGGYWVASADGSVFTYGDAPYEGGASGMHLNGPIIAGTGW